MEYHVTSKEMNMNMYTCNVCITNTFSSTQNIVPPQIIKRTADMLACCTGGPGFDPQAENPKISELSSAKSQLDVVRMRH